MGIIGLDILYDNSNCGHCEYRLNDICECQKSDKWKQTVYYHQHCSEFRSITKEKD